jgi:hypothetical protein
MFGGEAKNPGSFLTNPMTYLLYLLVVLRKTLLKDVLTKISKTD